MSSTDLTALDDRLRREDRSIAHGSGTSSPDKAGPLGRYGHAATHSAPVYVLSADGSSLFLLDASQRTPSELPPPYPTVSRGEPSQRRPSTSGPTELPPNSLGLVSNMSGHHSSEGSPQAGDIPTVRVSSDAGVRRQRAATTTATGRRNRASSDASERARVPAHSSAHTSPARPSNRLERMSSDTGPRRHTRSDASETYRLLADERTPLLGVPATSQARRSPGSRSIRSISISSNAPPSLRDAIGNAAASTPSSPSRPRPSSWRNMLRANSTLDQPLRVQTVNTASGEAIVVTRPRKKKHWAIRYASPLWSGAHWRALFHLVFINFPFALLLWPLLVAGTLAGTVLLVLLPIGALVWLITLLLSRSACRLEISMQKYFHSPLASDVRAPVYHPIFQRIKTVQTPHGSIRPALSPVEARAPDGSATRLERGDGAETLVWEKNVFKNAWAMFCDHLSYQGLSYLILTKALITLPSFLIILVVVPISAALIVPLPGALELVRRFGRWQAGVAIEALA